MTVTLYNLGVNMQEAHMTSFKLYEIIKFIIIQFFMIT